MNFIERMQAEKARVAKEIEELEQQTAYDRKVLEDLRTDYLYSSDIKDFDFVNSQIKKVTSDINKRKERIEFLQTKNPKLQEIYTEDVKKKVNELIGLEEQAEALFQKLEPLHMELKEGLEQMVNISYKVVNLKSGIKSHSEKLTDEELRNEANAKANKDNPVPTKINSLLIDSSYTNDLNRQLWNR